MPWKVNPETGNIDYYEPSTGGGGGGGANLTFVPGINNGVVVSDSGSDATILPADATNAGLILASEKSKLAGIQAGAEVNVQSDWNAVSGDALILNKPTALPPNGSAGGDLTGSYPNPNVHKIHGVDFQNGTPAANDLWIYDTPNNRWKHDSGTPALVGLGSVPNVDATNRSNHSGTQTASTISDFNAAALTAAPAETTTTEGALINGATSKTTPVDADAIGLVDSAASSILKKLTWANAKATLKAYFDTLYAASTSAFIPKLTGNETFRGVNYANNSTTETTSGGITMSTSASTAARAVSTTSYATRTVRKGFVASVVSGGRYTGTRGTALLWYVSGGFKYVCDFYISDTAYGSGCRQFFGLQGTTADLTYTDVTLVASLLNCIGVGSDSADANLQIFHNDGSGTCTKIDLGASFPSNRSAGAALTTIYSVTIYNAPNSSSVLVEVVNKETGAIAQNTLTNDLPATTQGLNFFASRCMGGGGGLTNSGQFDLAILGVYSV